MDAPGAFELVIDNRDGIGRFCLDAANAGLAGKGGLVIAVGFILFDRLSGLRQRLQSQAGRENQG